MDVIVGLLTGGCGGPVERSMHSKKRVPFRPVRKKKPNATGRRKGYGRDLIGFLPGVSAGLRTARRFGSCWRFFRQLAFRRFFAGVIQYDVSRSPVAYFFFMGEVDFDTSSWSLKTALIRCQGEGRKKQHQAN
jgi:hypothetical protein